MKAVLQRVRRASVSVGGETVASIGPGLLVLLGVAQGDGEADARKLARKTAELRIFADDRSKFNLSLLDVGGEALVVSQFTLLADCRKGRRPSFTDAAPPQEAAPLVECYVQALRGLGVPTQTGRFGALMQVELVNDGPVTIVLDSREL
ncbi:MAG TPA: D-aminoacyl-tRNA deacylase [Dehalococcoidia bacterium]|nr:D-aminoacyl-tRNA deacylase [Dehalococcoidia bacterium]